MCKSWHCEQLIILLGKKHCYREGLMGTTYHQFRILGVQEVTFCILTNWKFLPLMTMEEDEHNCCLLWEERCLFQVSRVTLHGAHPRWNLSREPFWFRWASHSGKSSKWGQSLRTGWNSTIHLILMPRNVVNYLLRKKKVDELSLHSEY